MLDKVVNVIRVVVKGLEKIGLEGQAKAEKAREAIERTAEQYRSLSDQELIKKVKNTSNSYETRRAAAIVLKERGHDN